MNIVWAILFLLLPLAGQYYASLRVWQLLPDVMPLKIVVVAIMAMALIAFIVCMSGLMNKMSLGLATIFYEVGTSWLVIMFYLVMLFGVLDLAITVHLIPVSFLRRSLIGSVAVTVFMVGLFTYAYLNFDHKQRVEILLNSEGKVHKPVKLIMISDLHLGYHNRRSDLHRWLELIKKEKPNAILIAGDLIDRSIRPVSEENSAEEFRQLSIPVYAIFGNHDYYTGISAEREFCHQCGIQIIQDSVAYFGDIAIVGRDDRTNRNRKSLKQIMHGIDRSKYIIEMDHQPRQLEEARQNGVDFEFAGHTHNGQVWPLNWICNAIYEDAFGPLTKGKTKYYVSSGLGIWGAKFRIGTQSEYIVAIVK